MAVIGGFRSDLSTTRKTDGNFGNVSAGVLFSKSCINENGGKLVHLLKMWVEINYMTCTVMYVCMFGIIWLIYHGGYAVENS